MSAYVSEKSPTADVARRVAALVDRPAGDDDSEHAHRDVDEEDPAPVDVLSDQAAEQRADGQRHGGDARPDADRHAPLTGREGRGDDAERRRVHDRRAETLDGAGADQEVRIGSKAARE
jgi:hypothetical protein